LNFQYDINKITDPWQEKNNGFLNNFKRLNKNTFYEFINILDKNEVREIFGYEK